MMNKFLNDHERIEAVKLGKITPEQAFRVFVDELVLIRGHRVSKHQKLVH